MKGLVIRDAQMDAFRQSLARALHLRLAAAVRSACADETASWSDPMLLAVIADEVTRAREHDIIDEIDCLHYIEFLFRHGARGVTPAMPAVPAWAAEILARRDLPGYRRLALIDDHLRASRTSPQS